MKDNEIQKLVFCHPNFQTDFQRTANTSAPVLQHLMKMGVIKDKEKRELFVSWAIFTCFLYNIGLQEIDEEGKASLLSKF